MDADSGLIKANDRITVHCLINQCQPTIDVTEHTGYSTVKQLTGQVGMVKTTQDSCKIILTSQSVCLLFPFRRINGHELPALKQATFYRWWRARESLC